MVDEIRYPITRQDAPTLQALAGLMLNNLRGSQMIDNPQFDTSTAEFFANGHRYTMIIKDCGPGEPEVPG